MSINVNEYLNKLKNKVNEIEDIKDEIKTIKKEYDLILKNESNKLNDAYKSLDELKEVEIPVRLKDLIDEIYKLSNKNSNNVNVVLETSAFFHEPELTMKKMLNKISTNYRKEGYTFTLSIDDENNNIEYIFTFPLRLEDKQADGKSLLEHCSVIHLENSENYLDSISALIIDKNIDEIILNIPLVMLTIKDNSPICTDRDLFNKAVLNCAQRDYEKLNILK